MARPKTKTPEETKAKNREWQIVNRAKRAAQQTARMRAKGVEPRGPARTPKEVEAYQAGYRAEHREKNKEYATAYYADHRSEARAYWLKRNYDLSIEDWDRMILEQAGECAICEVPMERPDVDHIHGTKIVRGLLCQRCNRAIGSFDDSPDKLRRATAYVERTLP